MTNIQAIYLLKDLEQSLDDYCELNDEGKTAFRMAITALEVFGNSEQLPSAQPSGKDPIEREAVVDILHDAMQGCSESEENLIGEIVCKVDLLPSAQPIPTKTEDLIRRGDAIEAIYRRIKQLGLEYDAGVLSIRQAVREVPSAQPYTEDEIQKIQDLEQAQLDKMYELGRQTAQAEIIHCLECKHWKTNHPTANGYHCCHRIHNVFPMREDDFCSRAERRKND